MTTKPQFNFNPKLYKLFDEYEVGKMWKKSNSASDNFVALEDKAYVILKLSNTNLNEMIFFKKGAIITINDSLMEYYENDLY